MPFRKKKRGYQFVLNGVYTDFCDLHSGRYWTNENRKDSSSNVSRITANVPGVSKYRQFMKLTTSAFPNLFALSIPHFKSNERNLC